HAAFGAAVAIDTPLADRQMEAARTTPTAFLTAFPRGWTSIRRRIRRIEAVVLAPLWPDIDFFARSLYLSHLLARLRAYE
ncbi:MAG TPA: hypothetical protein VG408_03005, partial [Actinomycetota bacterium]|nr:hypothetical protein [Actinomycetota bacterium]